jgi:carboxylesterase type B
MESPSFGAQLTIDEAQYQYDALVKRVKCDTAQDTLKCLRDTAPDVIPHNNPDLPTPGGGGGKPIFMWSAVVDGDFVEDHSYSMFTNGKFIKVPIISGYGSLSLGPGHMTQINNYRRGDTNEGTIFTPANMDNYTQVNNFLKNNFPLLDASQLAAIDHLYPQAEQFPGRALYWRTAANAYGEMRYNCPSIYISSQFDARGVQNNFQYNWNVLNQANAKNGLGVTHTAEAAAIWGNAAPTEANLTPIIQSYWTSFIRTAGDPNKYKNSSAPEWTRFDKNGMQRIRFENDDTKTVVESVDAGQQARCKYLSSIGGAIGQ